MAGVVLVAVSISCGPASTPGPSSTSPSSSPSSTASSRAAVHAVLSGEIVGGFNSSSVSPGRPSGTSLLPCTAATQTFEAIFDGPVNGSELSLELGGTWGQPDSLLIVLAPTQGSQSQPTAMSTFHGRADFGADGFTFAFSGDLARGGGPVVEHVSGNLICQH